jgi:predicted RNase H-like HicB family nuclease
MEYEIGAILIAVKSGYEISFPDLPQIKVGGATIAEAEANAEEALMFELEWMLDEGQEIPAATPLDRFDPEPADNEIDRFMMWAEAIDPDSLPDDEDEDEGAPRQGIGIRHFLFEPDGTLKHLPIRVANGLMRGNDTLPEYTNQRIRGLRVVLDVEDRKPVAITSFEADIWRFDESGSVQQNFVNAAFAARQTFDDMRRELHQSPGAIVSVRARMARRQWERENRWKPTDTDMARVVDAIWPEASGRPVERLQSITGTAKRRLPVTYQAKNAISQILHPTFDIRHAFERLGDKDLAAFIQEAEERLGDPIDFVGNEIWKGIAAAARKDLDIRKARKTSKGKWFAAIEKTHDQSVTTVEFRECDGRAAAVKAAREMLAKHSELFDANTTVEALLYPEIEWSGPF